jgi:hypothetical protein
VSVDAAPLPPARERRQGRLTAAALALAVPGLARQFRKVPGEYWRLHGSTGLRAAVECPCGNRPVLSVGELRSCRELDACPHRCERQFMFTGKSMLVAGGPKS